jgi:hypothetical protein
MFLLIGDNIMKRRISRAWRPFMLVFGSAAIIAALVANVMAQEPAKQGDGGFAFPDDASGKELSKKLPATGSDKLPGLPAIKPLPRVVPLAIKHPTATPAQAGIVMPSLPGGAGPAVTKPASVSEELPLADYAALPALPPLQNLEVSPAVSVPSPDVNKPPVVILVTQPTPDTNVPQDPSQEASHQAALAGSPSSRTEAAPFLRLLLPDPFAARRVSELYETPAEDSNPITVTPVVPGP